MNNFFKNNAVIDAIIYLKSGKRKHGVLVDNSADKNDTFHFISNTNFNLFQKTNNPDFIEIVSGKLIAAIDMNLK